MWKLWSLILGLTLLAGPLAAQPSHWRGEWPRTDFTRYAVAFEDILSGGPPKDGIPSIDSPRFEAAGSHGTLAPTEPVLSIAIAGDVRAYPLRILMWHEIVNDTVAAIPVAVTYCPLCNTGLVFKRVVDGRTLDFGTTGKLRNSDLVMYDRQTESWWQQFVGEGIVGEMTGKRLEIVASRLESWAAFRARAPASARVLVPPDPPRRPYGTNPYEAYDGRDRPYPLFTGELPKDVAALARIVVVREEGRPVAAWTLDKVR